jgi:thioredoxin-related protein
VLSAISGKFKILFSASLVLAIGLGAACIEQQGQGQDQPPAPQAKPQGRRPHVNVYDKSADPKIQVEKAIAQAKREHKQILLMFGGDWCGWCHKLHDLFDGNAEIKQTLANEYVLVMIENSARNTDAVLEPCKAALSPEESKRGFGYPFLAVLDASGKLVKAQPTDVLEEGDHHDPKKVLDFLNRYKPAPEDAKVVLEESLSRAAAADKRVFLHFGAPWCGWCHKLDEWLAQPEIAAILDRDLIIAQIDIDRMKAGKDVMMKYRASDSGGIPWYAILDSKGKSLATADGPNGNIGYPFKPNEIDHFLSTIKTTSRKIDAEQLEKLHRSLADAAERIDKQMHR